MSMRKFYWSNILFLFLLLCLSSCLLIAKKLYHVRNPKVETVLSVEKYLQKEHLPSNTLTLDSAVLSPYEHNGIIPEFDAITVDIYNPQGYLIYIEQNHCNYRILDSVTHKRNYDIDTTKSLKKIQTSLNDINGNPLQNQLLSNGKNYTFIVYWTIWSGKLSTELINSTKQYTDSTSNYKLVLVNCDFLDRWQWIAKYNKTHKEMVWKVN